MDGLKDKVLPEVQLEDRKNDNICPGGLIIQSRGREFK
jgi:hypothetical protein